MPIRVELDWGFNPESGMVYATREDSVKILGTKTNTAMRFEIDRNTVFGKDVWPAWWNKKPLAISYDEYTFGPNIKNPPTVVAREIQQAPEGAKIGQLFTSAKV